MRTMPSAASANMPPRLRPMIVYAANCVMSPGHRLQEQCHPPRVDQVPRGALSAVEVKHRFGSWAPRPYESGIDQPVWKFWIPFKARMSEACVRFEPAALAAATNTIAAVHACCV